MKLFKPNIQRLAKKKNVHALVKVLKDADCETSVRLASISALGEISDLRAVETLIETLEDSDSGICQNAAATLDRLGYSRALELEPLVTTLRDKNRGVRERITAASVLGRLGDSRAVDLLVSVLRVNDRVIREQATTALVTIGTAALEPLIVALRGNDREVRAQAAIVLGRLGDDRAIEPLIQALRDEDREIRRQVIEALRRLRDDRAVEPLIQALRDNDRVIREQATTALVTIGTAALESLIVVLTDHDGEMRAQAATILGRLGDPRAVEPLIESLSDNNGAVRMKVVEALGQLGDDRAVEPLIKVLSDDSREVREQVAAALTSYGWQPRDEAQSAWLAVIQQDWDRASSLGAAALEPLVAVLKDNDERSRTQAARALGRLGDRRAVEPLSEALRNGNREVRAQAVEALGRLGGTRAVEALIEALKYNDPWVRERVVEALGQLGDLHAVEALIELLKDNDREIREQATGALVSIGTAALELLIEVLKANNIEMRILAAAVLGRFKYPRAVVALTEALQDGSFEVRDQAARALREIGAPAGIAALDGYWQGERVDPFQEVSHLQPQPRHLHVKHPDQARVGDPIPLQVRVALSPELSKSTPLRAFSIPPQGVDVKLALDCPGFLPLSSSIKTVHVVPDADSDWVLFELEALHEGIFTLEISAYHGSAFLGTLYTQLTVGRSPVRGQNVEHLAFLSLRPPQEGEVTLVIHYDPFSAVYRYQFCSTFVETGEFRSKPLLRKQEEAIADLIASLDKQARDKTGYSAEEARRWLQGKGAELWHELIPKELENLFWQQRNNIKFMTILSAGDPMPWEVMYPTNDAGDDAGFLAEQFPVVRWMFGPAPASLLHSYRPYFVISEDAPPAAKDELAMLRQIIGEGQKVNELTPLLSMFEDADFDMLHFACHNIFHPYSPTSSSIQLGSKQFVPTFLSKYKGRFYQRSPFVFINGCRSDGQTANYTWLAGWAKSFLTAGAGAFIGSLWEVRDDSASRFAEEFYQALFSGASLGDAMRRARSAIQDKPSDPTWLAYTLYGNPAAILIKETSKLG